jgi:hypothetical protein
MQKLISGCRYRFALSDDNVLRAGHALFISLLVARPERMPPSRERCHIIDSTLAGESLVAGPSSPLHFR